jgi:hypothetical protein
MPYLNVDLSFVAYNDGPASRQPLVKLSDLKWSMLGLNSSKTKTIPYSLAPGETMVVASTARTLSYDGSTSFDITVVDGLMRLSASIGQRTSRAMGDSTTAWTLVKTGEVVRLTSPSGTAPTWASIQVGDLVNFSDMFQVYNQGEFLILSKGSNYIEFKNALGANETAVIATLAAYSSGPVQVGDTLDITDPAFSFPNQGAFPVVAVTDSYIDVVNPNAFTQTVTGVASGLSIYPYAYKWLLMACDRRTVAGLNGDAPTSLEIEPHVEGDLNKAPGLFMKRGKVFEVRVKNPGLSQAEGFLVLSE